LGATASHRGWEKPLAKTDTLNPGGTCGRKFAGGDTTTGQFPVRNNLARMRAFQPPTLSRRITASHAIAISTNVAKLRRSD
jgi:hypothetical protein